MLSLSIADMIDGLQKKQFSSRELCQFYLDRIQSLDSSLNAFISVFADRALTQADAADATRAAGEANSLTGIPLAHKDIFCTQGDRTTCGSKMLDHFISPYDATVVTRLREAGTIMLGKTNMDEFAMGSSTENSFYGPTRNPWDHHRVPGGSSGGSACAVAAGLVPAATGTDTGGSIRQPASLCGITGLKPTYGRVSRWGMIAYASSLDQAGPMTRSAEDAAYLLQAMAGHDPQDSTCINQSTDDYLANLNQSIQGLTIGLPKQYYQDLDAPIQQKIQEMINLLQQQGVKFTDVDLPHTEYAMSTYYIIAPAECSSNLSRYDGVRYGHRCNNPTDLMDLYRRSRSEGFGEETQRRILVGTHVLSSGYYDAYYLKAQKVRRLIRDDFIHAFEQVDLLLAPCTPSTAFPLQTKTNDPIAMYQSDIYTLATNLAGLPALSLPLGFIEQLPIGAQFIGPHFSEAKLLNVGHQYQQLTDWHLQRPQDISKEGM